MEHLQVHISKDVLNNILIPYLPVNIVVKLVKEEKISDLTTEDWYEIYSNTVLDKVDYHKRINTVISNIDSIFGKPGNLHVYKQMYQEQKNMSKVDFFVGQYTISKFLGKLTQFTYGSEYYTGYRKNLLQRAKEQKDPDSELIAYYQKVVDEKSFPDFSYDSIFNDKYSGYKYYDNLYQKMFKAEILEFLSDGADSYFVNIFKDKKDKKEEANNIPGVYEIGAFTNDEKEYLFQWFRNTWDSLNVKNLWLDSDDDGGVIYLSDIFDSKHFPPRLKRLACISIDLKENVDTKILTGIETLELYVVESLISYEILRKTGLWVSIILDSKIKNVILDTYQFADFPNLINELKSNGVNIKYT